MGRKGILVLMTSLTILISSIVLVHAISTSPDIDNATDTWYMMYHESVHMDGDDPSGFRFVEDRYSFDEEKNPLTIHFLEKGLFTGKLNGVNITGGAVQGHICFNIMDEDRGMYAHVEGKFKDELLILCVYLYEESRMLNLICGSYVEYVHEGCTGPIPDGPSVPDLSSISPQNGDGHTLIASGDGVASMYYDAGDFEFIRSGTHVGVVDNMILRPEFDTPVTTRCIWILKDNTNGTVNCAYAGMSGSVSISGDFLLADGLLQSYAYTHGGDDMHYHTATYGVDYPHGRKMPPTDVSGRWEGRLWYVEEDSLIESENVFVKDFSFFCDCFGCVDFVSSEGAHTWFGNAFGRAMFIATGFSGYSSYLFGTIDGDVITLCGFHIDTDGTYVGVSYEFHRST